MAELRIDPEPWISSLRTLLNQAHSHMSFVSSLSKDPLPLSLLKREKRVPWISFVCFLWALEELFLMLRMCPVWRASLNTGTFQDYQGGTSSAQRDFATTQEKLQTNTNAQTVWCTGCQQESKRQQRGWGRSGSLASPQPRCQTSPPGIGQLTALETRAPCPPYPYSYTLDAVSSVYISGWRRGKAHELQNRTKYLQSAAEQGITGRGLAFLGWSQPHLGHFRADSGMLKCK